MSPGCSPSPGHALHQIHSQSLHIFPYQDPCQHQQLNKFYFTASDPHVDQIAPVGVCVSKFPQCCKME